VLGVCNTNERGDLSISLVSFNCSKKAELGFEICNDFSRKKASFGEFGEYPRSFKNCSDFKKVKFSTRGCLFYIWALEECDLRDHKISENELEFGQIIITSQTHRKKKEKTMFRIRICIILSHPHLHLKLMDLDQIWPSR
jgi:hypothetical protein